MYGLPLWLFAQSSEVDSAASMLHLIAAEKHFLIEEYEQTRKLLDHSLAADPHNSAVHFKYAQLYALEKAYEKALSHIQTAIDLRPQNKHYYLEGAAIALQAFRLSEAIFYYKQLLDKVSGAAPYYKDLAELYLQSGAAERALAAYQKLEEKVGYSKALGLQRQKIYVQQKQFTAAIAESERLVTSFPTDEALQTSYAELLKDHKGPEAAISYLESLLKAAPYRSALALYLGKYYLVEEPSEAAKWLHVAFRDPGLPLKEKLALFSAEALPARSEWPLLDTLCRALMADYPTDFSLHNTSAQLYQAIGKPRIALSQYRKILRLGNLSLPLFEQMITLETALQQYDSALVHVEEGALYYPKQPLIYLLKGKVLHYQGSYTAAQASLKKGLALSLDDALHSRFYAQLGDTHQALSNPSAAETAYEKALALNPEEAEALNNYSRYLALQKARLPYAKRLSEHLIAVHPKQVPYLSTHARVLYATGNYLSAVHFLEEALQLPSPPSGALLEQYGDTLYQLKRPEEALIQWKKAKEHSGTSSLLDAKIANKKLYE